MIDIYTILAHPLRQKLLQIVEKEGYISYSDLMEKLGLETTGQLNFHLKKLGNLLGKEKKAYYLTEEGKKIMQIFNINKRLLEGEDLEHLDTRKSEINRVGVVICDCYTEISSTIDVQALENYTKKIPGVVSVKLLDNLCQVKNLKEITDWCKDNYLNKIVIAACSPNSHKHIFHRIFEDVIDHPNIEIANIREQCAWVHQPDPVVALKKAQILIEVAVERVKLQKSVQVKRVEVEKSCAILGGGIAGMTLALNLARAGIKVYLIEKSPTLGGKVALWSRIYGMGDCSICFLSELIGELVQEENIEILSKTEIVKVSGEVGNFTIDLIKKPRFVDEQKCTGCKQCTYLCPIEKSNKYEFGLSNRKLIYIPFTQAYPYVAVIDREDIETCHQCRICEKACVNNAIDLNQNPEKIRIKVGAKVVAIGADLYYDMKGELKRYKYNPQKDIITSPEFERILASGGPTEGEILKLSDNESPISISIFQNVGPPNYAAHFSDLVALKYLDFIREKLPFCKVDIFYDLSKIKDKFKLLLDPNDRRVHYVQEIEIKEIKGGPNIIITKTKDENNVTVSHSYPSDLIILNVNIVPNKDLKDLRKVLDFSLDDNGFMSGETFASGIYGGGTAMGPSGYNSTIAQMNYVALKVISLLSQDYLTSESSGIEIVNERCGLCGLCVISCPYNALTLESDKVMIDKFKCKGCGMCVSVCPTKSLEMNIDSTEKIQKTIEVLSKAKAKPKILAFCCHSCGYGAADEAGLKKIQYNPNTFIIEVPCSGRVDTNFILHAFECEFDGVIVIGCGRDSCRYIDGIEKVRKKIKLIQDVIGPFAKKRLIRESLSADQGTKFAEIVDEFYYNLIEEIKSEE
ncbi:MAG: hydrogenase iron-sulfur subunit [Candidatus Helarchaeota archaeon]|nr:hydrogenase iron-sulfur subunit [Candidatus Helarchaeota archaeon]